MDRRWRIPAVISGLTNLGLVVLLGVLGHIQTPTPDTEEVVEVQLVHEEKGGEDKLVQDQRLRHRIRKSVKFLLQLRTKQKRKLYWSKLKQKSLKVLLL